LNNSNYYQQGFSFIGVIVTLALNMLILSAILHFLFTFTKTYNNLQRKLDYQNSLLIAYHYLAIDLRNSGYNYKPAASSCKAIVGSCLGLVPKSIESLIKTQDIQPNSDILILNSSTQQIAYYLRKSIATKENHWHSYTLYRDDFNHNSVALAEGFINFQVKFKKVNPPRTVVQVNLEFKNLNKMELIFVPRTCN